MKLLLAEDDAILADALSANLALAGFEVDVAPNGAVAEYLLLRQQFDLGVLDLGLPLVDGLTVLKRVRAARPTLPMLVLTALDGLDHRVAGLNAGADDYLTKPFAFDELLARVRALLRRSELVRPTVLALADLSLDPMSQRVLRGGMVLELTHKEFAILQILLRHAGEVVSRSRLAEQVWKDDLISIDNLIDVHISNLRRKVDAPPAAPLIQTVRGRGFRLAPADDGAGAASVAHA